jgi:hypothetical protein
MVYMHHVKLLVDCPAHKWCGLPIYILAFWVQNFERCKCGGWSLATFKCSACGVFTTGDDGFPECQMHSGKTQNHSGKAQNHSGKPSPSATLGEEPPGMPLTGKSSSPSAKNRTLREDFPECRSSTRGRGKTSPSAVLALGEELTPSVPPAFF